MFCLIFFTNQNNSYIVNLKRVFNYYKFLLTTKVTKYKHLTDYDKPLEESSTNTFTFLIIGAVFVAILLVVCGTFGYKKYAK